MKAIVALEAQSDQVLLAILATLTPEPLVMDLKLVSAAAILASPFVSPQGLQAKSFIRSSV
jgi:hypothetical protein